MTGRLDNGSGLSARVWEAGTSVMQAKDFRRARVTMGERS